MAASGPGLVAPLAEVFLILVDLCKHSQEQFAICRCLVLWQNEANEEEDGPSCYERIGYVELYDEVPLWENYLEYFTRRFVELFWSLLKTEVTLV